MTIYIFCGPSLPHHEARQLLDAVYLPPAAQGDIYRVARTQPRAIGIIDGYFERVPSIWHKEILWAMREGVHVFGSASMGALRAAELAAFGMQGVGEIFDAYTRGELEDDEVAVAHASEAHGYRPLSVAMVNIRATLAAAQAQRVIGLSTHGALVAIGKALFYPDRSYPRLLAEAAEQGCDRAEIARLRDWLPRGQVDQKRADALALLRAIGEQCAGDAPPKRVRYHFEHTIYWEYVQQTSDAGLDEQVPDQEWRELLLDEARIEPATYQQARQRALAVVLALALAEQQGQQAIDERITETIMAFRSAHELFSGQRMADWLAAHDLSEQQFIQLMQRDTLVQTAVRWAAPTVAAQLLDQLRLDESYPRLRDRARQKRVALNEAGLADPDMDHLGLSRSNLLRWYFVERLGRPVPSDLAQYVRTHGFPSERGLLRAALREFCYRRLTMVPEP